MSFKNFEGRIDMKVRYHTCAETAKANGSYD